MRSFWQEAMENPSAAAIKVMLVVAFAMVPIVLLDSLAQAEAVKPKLVYSFTVATWHQTTFSGIPFLVECKKENVDQWFELRAKKSDGQYLPLVGKGFLQAYNIVWIGWPEPFKLPAKTRITFELYTSGPDRIGIKNVSLIADHAFAWNGDEPINPPEE